MHLGPDDAGGYVSLRAGTRRRWRVARHAKDETMTRVVAFLYRRNASRTIGWNHVSTSS